MVQPLWLLLPVVAIVALLVGFVLQKLISERKLGEAGARATRIVGDAERDAEARHRAGELEAKEIVLKARGEFDTEVRRRERELQQIEQRIIGKEEQLARKLDDIERRLAEEARRQLVAQMEDEAKREAQLIGMRLEEQARETAREKAKEVLATTIQRLAPDYTVETAVSVVDLPSDDMKGRIIGREGRNIRALELHTGVDLIVDDTPEAVLISAYDPYRREVARRSLQVLIADGRIHPARIEEVVEKIKKER